MDEQISSATYRNHNSYSLLHCYIATISLLDMSDNQTVAEKFKDAVRQYRIHRESPDRKDLIKFQSKLQSIIHQFRVILAITNQLALFSDNETIEEVNTKHLPFLLVNYYLGTLYLDAISDPKAAQAGNVDPIEFRTGNLETAKTSLISFLVQAQQYGALSKLQSDQINGFKDTFNPTLAELVPSNPAERRQIKIDNHRLEKQLNEKLLILNEFYDADDDDDDNGIEFGRFDDDTVRAIYTDQVTLFVLNSFSLLESIIMELKVLQNRPTSSAQSVEQDQREKPNKDNDYGFTTRLESLPNQKKGISDLISKQGKILQPFTITSSRQQMRDKVFGTGQVLPSMTVEEYLDYELANGKMMKEEVKDKNKEDDDTEDSDEELEKRRSVSYTHLDVYKRQV